MLCSICCKCDRWSGPWYKEPHNCPGQWEISPEGKQFYNPCNHLRCERCGKGNFPLPCAGERTVILKPNVTDMVGLVSEKKLRMKKFHLKRKKFRNRNRNS